MARIDNWVDEFRNNVTAGLKAVEAAKAQILEEQSADYMTSLDDTTLQRDYGINKQQIADAMASLAALDNFLTVNFHYTNLYKVRA